MLLSSFSLAIWAVTGLLVGLTLLTAAHKTLRAARDPRRTHRPGPVGRARAAELLGAAGYSEARPELELLLSDRHPAVRAAARALGKLGDPAAVPALSSALQNRRAAPAGVVPTSWPRCSRRWRTTWATGSCTPGGGSRGCGVSSAVTTPAGA